MTRFAFVAIPFIGGHNARYVWKEELGTLSTPVRHILEDDEYDMCIG